MTMDRAHACAARAGIFRHTTYQPAAYAIFFALAINSILLTALLRRSVLGHVIGSPDPSSAAPAASSPVPSPDSGVQISEDLPPPYSEEEQSTAEESPSASARAKKIQVSKLRTTTAFMYGTILFALNILLLVLLAFAIECIVFCAKWPSNPNPTVGEIRIVAIGWWFLYAFVVLWATFGATSWAVLLRDYLSGPDVAYKVSIEPAFGLIAIIFVAFFPFAFAWFLVSGLVKLGVRWTRALMSGVKVDRQEEAARLMEMGRLDGSSTGLPEEGEAVQNDALGSKPVRETTTN
ncbi:hypothetical protein F5884DRAFT_859026 [Xylogone sp. PMI_703]|nr:hypothetical protein F5884DRAFT_859026 [Xylogone sp. PMI_703]